MHYCQTNAQIKRLPQRAQQRLYNILAHIFDKLTRKKLTLRQLLQNPETTDIWSKSASNEFEQLMAGNDHGISGTEAMTMIHPDDISSTKKVIYVSIVCDYMPLKKEPY